MAESTPTVFGGRYEMHRRIARGGMAVVYLARDQLLDRWVAIKVLNAQFAADPTFVERFRREAQAAAKLSHPNIVAVYDWGEEDGTYFIVMEYIEGLSLSQLLTQEGKLDPQRAAEITIEVARGLGYAHSKGYVHLDTKSANVLISKKGEVKVADFGISKAIAGGVESNLTQTGAVMGTASYFSPEQAQGQRVGPPSDLYSLGVVLFETLSGRTPFQGETSVTVAFKHVQEPPPSFRDVNVNVPPPLEAIDMKLLKKSPDDRYADADALIADLQRFLAGQPVEAMASAPGGPERTQTAAATSIAMTAAAPRAVQPPVYGGGAPQPVSADATTAMPVPVYDRAPASEPEYYAPVHDRGSPVGMIFGGLFLLLGVIAGVGVLVYLLSSPGGGSDGGGGQKIQMVDYVGRPLRDVEPVLTSNGLKMDIEYKESTEYPADIIMETDPKAGEIMETGDTVKLVVSSGEAPIKVPDVVDVQEADAVAQLERAGFVVNVTYAASDEGFAGAVISQSPEANQEMSPGGTVNITVSQGPKKTPVTDVTGYEYGQADQALREQGFETTRTDEYSDTVDPGYVIRTEPPANVEADPGAYVEIFVSVGPQAAPLPNVIGMDLAAAQITLQNGGYVINVVNVSTTEPAQDGAVLSQDPAPDTPWSPGSAVVIEVGVLDTSGGNGGDGGNNGGNGGNNGGNGGNNGGDGGNNGGDGGNTGGDGGNGGGDGGNGGGDGGSGGGDGSGQGGNFFYCTGDDGRLVECDE